MSDGCFDFGFFVVESVPGSLGPVVDTAIKRPDVTNVNSIAIIIMAVAGVEGCQS